MKPAASSTVEASGGIERRNIDMIPDRERHGSPWSQFTLWFGANLQITAIVTGALAVVFGADAWSAILGLPIGSSAAASWPFTPPKDPASACHR